MQKATLLLLLLRAVYGNDTDIEDQPRHRDKRYLLFPFQGTFKTVFSFAIPWKLGPKQEMGVGWNLQFQFPLPYNTTVITNFPTVSRRNRNKRDYINEDTSDRALLYKGIENILSKNGIEGKECVLKTICEYAGSAFPNGDEGILNQVFHVFLTPNYNDGPDPTLDPIYSDAQKAGEYGVDCQSMYYRCNMDEDLFDVFAGFEQQ